MVLLLLVAGTGGAAGAPAPSVERIVSLPSLTGTAPSSPVWSPDSTRVAFLWNDEGMPFRDVWVVDADGGNLKRLTRLAPEHAPAPEPGLSRETLAERIANRAREGLSEVLWSRDSTRVLYGYQGQLFSLPSEGGVAQRVLGEGSGRSRFSFSPDGERLAYIERNDLWVHDFEHDKTQRVTAMGVPGIGRVPVGAYNRPDVVVSRTAWSSDGRFIAFQTIDQRAVRRMPIPSYLYGEEPFMHEVRRPYPGDRDLVQRLAIFDTESGSTRLLDLELPRQRLFHEFVWAPDRPELLIHQGSDVGEDRWLRIADARSGVVRELWHDHRPRRIYPIFRALWSADGERVVFLGDTDDYYRLYSIDADGGSAEMLTIGDYDVVGTFSTGYVNIAGDDGALFFVSSRKSPYERHLYRMPPGEQPTRITRREGEHDPLVSPDGRHFASIMSSDEHPAELYLGAVGTEDASVRVTRSPPDAFYRYDWIEPRYVTFPSRIDGYTLHARIVEPRDMRPGDQYPVLIGNIYSNTVRNAWDADRPTTNLQQRLALTGDYIHVQVDLRGSLGYGVNFREAFQGDWGGDDLEDLMSTVDYLKTLDYVDPGRIGVWGNSYGGLMVLAALFKQPGVFAAGVAGAPAVDIRHFTGFDQHLTRRPDTHPEIFDNGSLLDLGEDLEDPLLIIHGMHDDIVPYKTTLMMTEKLMMLGKDFDLISIPNAPHWWGRPEHYGIYTFRKLEDFFRRHILPGPVPAPELELEPEPEPEPEAQ
ncbi:MAG: prolyl oligopeptidase family serine peptidase [Wenzhouxiangellaceae bacterium]